VTVNPDAAKSYAVPAGISANGYSSTLSWDSALNLTQVNAPNSASSVYGYDTAGRNTSAVDPDGATSSAEYFVSGKLNVTASGKRRTWTYVDGIGRPVKMSTGYMPDNSQTGVGESSVDTEYEPCACSPFGKVKRVSQPYAPGQEASRVWTVYTYDELGRVSTATHPPNTGTSGNSGVTTYVYELNTVKVTDPAGRWKKYEMDGFGNLVKVTEPKPVSGEYMTSYVYSALNELKTVTMTRDGFTGGSPATITQTRRFTYSGGRLHSTQLPEVPGTTTYAYNPDGTLLSKTDYKGVRKYYYTAAKQLERVERYPGAVGQPEDVKGRVENFYNVIPAAAGTSFVGQNLQGRLAAAKYNCDSLGMNCM
jgi:YD repeat-containing protein